MQRFVVTREHQELWSVKQEGVALYRYRNEDEARSAALALANSATEAGAAASVVIVPPTRDLRDEVEFEPKKREFTGM